MHTYAHLKLFVIADKKHLILTNHLESTPKMTAVHTPYQKSYCLDWLNVTVSTIRQKKMKAWTEQYSQS